MDGLAKTMAIAGMVNAAREIISNAIDNGGAKASAEATVMDTKKLAEYMSHYGKQVANKVASKIFSQSVGSIAAKTGAKTEKLSFDFSAPAFGLTFRLKGSVGRGSRDYTSLYLGEQRIGGRSYNADAIVYVDGNKIHYSIMFDGESTSSIPPFGCGNGSSKLTIEGDVDIDEGADAVSAETEDAAAVAEDVKLIEPDNYQMSIDYYNEVLAAADIINEETTFVIDGLQMDVPYQVPAELNVYIPGGEEVAQICGEFIDMIKTSVFYACKCGDTPESVVLNPADMANVGADWVVLPVFSDYHPNWPMENAEFKLFDEQTGATVCDVMAPLEKVADDPYSGRFCETAEICE